MRPCQEASVRFRTDLASKTVQNGRSFWNASVFDVAPSNERNKSVMSTAQGRTGESNGQLPVQPSHSDEALPRFVRTSDCAIFTLDHAGRVITWNAGAERVFGYSRDEAVGQFFYHFFALDAVRNGNFERDLNDAFHDGQALSKRQYVHKDGRRFWASGIITPLWDHEFQGYGTIVQRDGAESDRLQADV
jgi:PAS domain S-box-containing protein